jgi:hypothetical protein
MRVQLADITKSYGAQVVLEDVDLTIGPARADRSSSGRRRRQVDPAAARRRGRARPIAARQRARRLADRRLPRAGAPASSRESPSSTRSAADGCPRRRAELEDAAGALARRESATSATPVRSSGSSRSEAATSSRERGRSAPSSGSTSTSSAPGGLSGGEPRRSRSPRSSSRASTFSCSTSRRTTWTSTAWSGSSRSSTRIAGALVLVSHDRELLDRTVDRIVASIELAPRSGVGRRVDGLRGRARRRARGGMAEFEQAQLRRQALAELLSTGVRRPREGRRSGTRRRRRSARDACARDEGAPGRATPRAQRASRRSRSSRGSCASRSRRHATLRPRPEPRSRGRRAGAFRLGPIDVDLARASASRSRAERRGQVDAPRDAPRRVPLARHTRVGRRTVIGAIGQERRRTTAMTLWGRVVVRTGCWPWTRARCSPSSSSRRPRSHGRVLAVTRRATRRTSPSCRQKVNVLVPGRATNHLDLELGALERHSARSTSTDARGRLAQPSLPRGGSRRDEVDCAPCIVPSRSWPSEAKDISLGATSVRAQHGISVPRLRSARL